MQKNYLFQYVSKSSHNYSRWHYNSRWSQ